MYAVSTVTHYIAPKNSSEITMLFCRKPWKLLENDALSEVSALRAISTAVQCVCVSTLNTKLYPGLNPNKHKDKKDVK